jgi:hypothetical protein
MSLHRAIREIRGWPDAGLRGNGASGQGVFSDFGVQRAIFEFWVLPDAGQKLKNPPRPMQVCGAMVHRAVLDF